MITDRRFLQNSVWTNSGECIPNQGIYALLNPSLRSLELWTGKTKLNESISHLSFPIPNALHPFQNFRHLAQVDDEGSPQVQREEVRKRNAHSKQNLALSWHQWRDLTTWNPQQDPEAKQQE